MSTCTKLSGHKFPLGRIVMTRGVQAALFNQGLNPVKFLDRHASGDWGDLDEGDKQMNDRAVKHGDDRIFSSYKVGDELTVWVITEADRSVTTLLLPEEY